MLLLKNVISLSGPQDRPEVSTQELMSLLASRLLDVNGANPTGHDAAAGPEATEEDDVASAAQRSNREQNISDAMAVLPTLATGLDVNLRFGHALDFEFTAELAVFDLLDVTLCHAWVVDPDDAVTKRAVGGRSYNQLVERIIFLDTAAEKERDERAGSPRPTRPGGFDPRTDDPKWKGKEPEVEVPESSPGNTVGASSSRARGTDASGADPAAEVGRATTSKPSSRDAADDGEAREPDTSSPLAMEHVDAARRAEEGVADGQVAGGLPTRAPSEEELVRRAMEMSLAEAQATADAKAKTAAVEGLGRTAAMDEPYVGGSAAAERVALDDFLTSSASQLTPYGLENARESVRERELAVFFRNNHFSTVFKLDGALYLLVTDQGYLREPEVVWEVLSAPDAATVGKEGRGPLVGTFVNGEFAPFVPHAEGDEAAVVARRTEEDAQIAAAMLASAAEGGQGTTPSGASGLLPPGFLQPPPAQPPGMAVGIPVGTPTWAGTTVAATGAGATEGHAGAARAADSDADHALAVALQAQYEEEYAAAQRTRQAERERAHQEQARRQQRREDRLMGSTQTQRRPASRPKSKSSSSGSSMSDCVVM